MLRITNLLAVIRTITPQTLGSFSTSPKYKLSEVGILDQTKATSYATGQIFLHRLFGYRGVILFPWTAFIFDKHDTTTTSPHSVQHDKSTSEELDKTGPPPKSLANKLTYYQVLIDNRDIPYIRSQPESVTFLSGPKSNRSVYSIQGLDYVSHHDVMPYTSTEKTPIVHELFEKFLMREPEDAHMKKASFVARESLRAWQESNQPWLELSDVYKRTTNDIRVTVIPFYIGVKEESERKKLYWWRYSIRIENLSDKPVILRERHWRIFSQAGTFETVRGKGVIGQEPYLNAEHSVFQYSSHVNLQAPSGHMWLVLMGN
jgi:polymerase delta-interacting protein 2